MTYLGKSLNMCGNFMIIKRYIFDEFF